MLSTSSVWQAQHATVVLQSNEWFPIYLIIVLAYVFYPIYIKAGLRRDEDDGDADEDAKASEGSRS